MYDRKEKKKETDTLGAKIAYVTRDSPKICITDGGGQFPLMK